MTAAVASDRAQGMGAILHREGVAFRVWAPHADSVSVMGTFNDWDESDHPMELEGNGFWYVHSEEAAAGDEYLFVIRNGDQVLKRIDPCARQVTSSVGNAIMCDPAFDWQGDHFRLPPRQELVIYELHVGTFGRRPSDADHVADLDAAASRLDYLKSLGINCIELMPVAEFAGDVSWGYNPAHIYAVESAYGGPNALKEFILQAHQRGIGVIVDVVYNHFGPSDLSLWQFDGWSENGMGGIYFYNDWRADTPWGSTRPDYGRGEVRQFLRDNALMWINEFHADGLRFDMTLYVRRVRADGDPGCDLPDGWALAQWINRDVHAVRPDALTIAEDLQNNAWLTMSDGAGGAGFSAQWDAGFVHPVREAAITMHDECRSMAALRGALEHCYNGDAFQRIVYSESHDEVANGKARVPEEIDHDGGDDWNARKRSTLAAVLALTVPGIPMLFQGQEFLQDGWFVDTLPLDWERKADYRGILRMYRDLIHLRTNRARCCSALQGSGLDVFHVDESTKTIAYRRWNTESPGDVMLVLMNLHRDSRTISAVVPSGPWEPVFNSDSQIYGDDFGNAESPKIQSDGSNPCTVPIGPYAAVIYRFIG